MTWHYQIQDGGEKLQIYDNGAEHSTIQNDGNGFQPKKEVLQKMEEEAIAEFDLNGYTERLINLLKDAAFENIERGKP
jgi:hypothetical protein